MDEIQNVKDNFGLQIMYLEQLIKVQYQPKYFM